MIGSLGRLTREIYAFWFILYVENCVLKLR